MKKVLTPSLLALYVSCSVVIANCTFNNDNIALLPSDTNPMIVLKDRRISHPITSQELFFLVLPDGTEVHIADFKIRHIKKQDNTIVIDFTYPDFSVTIQSNLVEGKYTSIDYTIVAVEQPRDVVGIALFSTKKQLRTLYADGVITNSPIIADSLSILPDKSVVNTYTYEATTNLNVELKTPIRSETPVSLITWFGAFSEASQPRRSMNQLINTIRPRPHKPYLRYNNWMDIGFFTPYTEQDVLGRVGEWNREFINGRGVALGAFLLNGGQDDLTRRWLFGPAFSNGFSEVREKTDSLHSSVGLWSSPWGGYNKPRDVRVSRTKEYGLEAVDGRLTPSGASYFKSSNKQIVNLIKNEHITSSKPDGMGNASSYIKSSPFVSNLDASIALLHNMRRANPSLFINLTTGTNANPPWLSYADSIWCRGDDINLYGPGTPVQQQVTCRDTETYRSIIRKGPLFPLNSLMCHGIVSVENAYYGLERVQTDSDSADQIWGYFAIGTQLQELYIAPSMLNRVKQDTLAKATGWSKGDVSVLADTYWISDDPTALATYGWVSWSKDKAILGLRDPSDKPQTYYLGLAKDSEIPAGNAVQFSLKAVHSNNKTVSAEYKDTTVITLQPLEMLVFEAVTVN